MIMLGMSGWKLEIQGGAGDLKRYSPGLLERLLDRIFGGKMLVVFAIKGGRPMLAKRSEIVLAEVKDDPPVEAEELTPDELAKKGKLEIHRTIPIGRRRPAGPS